MPRLLEFIEDLTNGYIRLNRDRFWGKDITADKIAAYSTLYIVIEELTMVMAPFTPFLAEHLYQELAKLTGQGAPKPLSVHLCSYPDPEESLQQPRLEEAVSRMQQVILLGRQRREEVKDQSAQADAAPDHHPSRCRHCWTSCALSSRSSDVN